MLQSPSKYHSNPLSHFLALHNSAVVSHQQIQAHHQQQLHQNQNQQYNGPNLDGNIATTLDVGKSFTIAAILGLQKNAIENSQKDYNGVVNLSLNHHNHNNNNNQKSNLMNNSGNNSNNNNNSNGDNINNRFSVNNNIDCDNLNSNTISRYYNSTNGILNSGNHHQNHHHHHHHQIRHQFTHHSAAAASVVAAAAAINVAANTPSALQSLQQLHQHHTQQTNLNFQVRDKLKSDHFTNKKSSSSSSSLKSKRVRTIFTPEQLERLEAEFERQQYMVGPERLYLAHTLQLTEAQVKVWFQNRRIKWRKHHLEITQQRLAFIRQTQLPSNESNNNINSISSNNINNVNDNNDNNENNSAKNNNHGIISDNNIINNSNNQLHHSESDISLCNDSIDDESFTEPEEV